MQLAGTSALITGGASGLGRAVAQALVADGVRVAILDLGSERVAAAAAELGVWGQVCDVTSAGSAEAAIDAAAAAIGPARILVNCAGIGTPGRAVGRNGPLDLSVFAGVIGVNLIGTFNMIRLAAHRMGALEPLADGERGVIVSTASIAAFDGQIGQAAYAASKGGVVAMTLPLAREFAGIGIRVNSIAPGLFLTPMLASLPEEAQVSLAKSIPFPARLGQPSEFAALVRHIITNPMLNGETIRLDGALRMAPR